MEIIWLILSDLCALKLGIMIDKMREDIRTIKAILDIREDG